MDLYPEENRDLVLLEQIEKDPDATQASLAAQLGVAIGTINWHLKRLVEKGYVKLQRAERRKLRYIITPEGIALRANLTMDYIQNSFRLYRLVRERMGNVLDLVKSEGYDCVRINVEEGDVADICRLTCIEREIKIVDDFSAPLLRVQGLKIFVEK
jgi:DNA-binding MarR family transcriptional regulator